MNENYILDKDGNPVRERCPLTLARWDEQASRNVGNDKIEDSVVSTVFLGIDHAYSGNEPPILWETMVFGGPLDQEMDRCPGSRKEAKEMHARMVERVKKLYTKEDDVKKLEKALTLISNVLTKLKLSNSLKK